jgi:hypothetical protein
VFGETYCGLRPALKIFGGMVITNVAVAFAGVPGANEFEPPPPPPQPAAANATAKSAARNARGVDVMLVSSAPKCCSWLLLLGKPWDQMPLVADA